MEIIIVLDVEKDIFNVENVTFDVENDVDDIEKAEKKEVIVEDFLATVFQHELDHLFGFLYVDRLNSTKDLVFEDELVNITKDKILD